MTDWQATDYNRHSALQRAMAESQLARLTLAGNEKILDVGCGDGKISAEIAARVPSGLVVGIDPSPSMIAFASQHFSPAAGSNLRFEVADVCRLPFQEEFDLVVSFNALHWVTAQASALHAIRSALRPGGSALLRMVPEGPRKSLEDVIEDIRRSDRWARYFRTSGRPYVHFEPAEYRRLAQDAGFRIEQLQVEDEAWDFQNRQAFFNFCEATFVEWTQLIPADDRPHFINDVLDRYAATVANSAGDMHTFKFYQMEIALKREP